MKRLYELIQKNLSFDKVSELFGKQLSKDQLPLITISREKGSGGRPIAHLVAKKLGYPWKVYHEEIVNEIVEKTHLETQLVKEVDEANIPLIDEIVADFFGRRYLNLSGYYKELIKILSTIGHRGHAVIVGRGADYLFPHALKIRIICEMDQRIKWMREFEKITRDEAVRRIDESDKKRIEFVETVFKHDPRKAHHYDLVVRTGTSLSIEDAADLIVRLAKRRFGI
jgi:cytidylate kinase